jgi:hypothetical protein
MGADGMPNTILKSTKNPVGTGFPAMAVCQPPSMLDVTPLSLASQLPQG